ncbi:hypothetical protein CEXT_778401 [Caerostris extrusa]|uniref:Uncharacterized protein n=1 Tax=Caerostris extrusa TaxID=172846 RepID=A0AAV4VSJ0_CAEEX|nr:hypothetical protein CEXT_778401 [Caerostris extrusa]
MPKVESKLLLPEIILFSPAGASFPNRLSTVIRGVKQSRRHNQRPIPATKKDERIKLYPLPPTSRRITLKATTVLCPRSSVCYFHLRLNINFRFQNDTVAFVNTSCRMAGSVNTGIPASNNSPKEQSTKTHSSRRTGRKRIETLPITDIKKDYTKPILRPLSSVCCFHLAANIHSVFSNDTAAFVNWAASYRMAGSGGTAVVFASAAHKFI